MARPSEPMHFGVQLASRLANQTGERDGVFDRLADLVDHEVLGGLVDVVEDVVDRRGEPVGVLAVEGEDERALELEEEVMCDAVPVVLDPADLVGQLGARGPGAEHPLEQFGGVGSVVARFDEAPEEAVSLGAGRRPRAGPAPKS